MESDLSQAGQILRGCMQDPLNASGGLGDHRQIRHLDRIDERTASALSSELDQIGALAVPIAGCALSVDSQGSCATRQCIGIGLQRREGGDDLGHSVSGLRRSRLRFSDLSVFDDLDDFVDVITHQARVRRRALPTCEMPTGMGARPAA